VNQAAARAREQQAGDYGFGAMHKATLSAPRDAHGLQTVHRLDCADYVGPVRVEQVPGKGRGLVATRDVAAGELVLAVKADAVQAIAEVSHLLYICWGVMLRTASSQMT
jgi:glutamine phosphoribosylpyrophosphate amidotransferase